MSEKCFDELSASMFLEDEVAPGEKKRIEAHLETCARCRELLKKLEIENTRLKEIFKTTTASGSPDLVPRVMKELDAVDLPWARLQPRKANLIHLSNYRWVWATAASILLAAFLAILVLLPGKQTPRDIPEEKVVLCYARVEGQEVQSHIYDDKDPGIQFIWLEKEK